MDSRGSPSPSPTCSGFALSLASDRGGQPSPIAAAAWFAQHGSVQGIPKIGWQEVRTGVAEATVQSEGVELHVIEGPDQTWQVDSGPYSCPPDIAFATRAAESVIAHESGERNRPQSGG